MGERRVAAREISAFFLVSMAVLLPAEAAERPEVPLDWQARAQRQIAEAEYQMSWQEGPSTLAPTWQAANRAQGFRTYFTETGPRVIPRTEDVPSWQWGLHFSEVGRGQTRLALEEPSPLVPQANRMTYRRGSIEEWYVNDVRGLKQGFTLSSRPDGDKDPLCLTFLLEGNLSPVVSADGQAIDFVTPEGVRPLRYAELLVTDARGQELPALMEGWSVDGVHGIRIVVEDREAVWPLTIDPLLTGPAWTAESDQVSAVFGFTVGAAGDVNGDGYGDVIIGAPQFDNGQTEEGRAFVYHGSASGLSLTPNWTAESNLAGAFFARAVGTAGDVNGDGYSDVIVSAPAFDGGLTDEGRAYVYYGSASGLPANESWSAEGNQANAQFSWSLGTAGDVNGDGYSDVIVGSQLFDNGQTNEGRAFVYHGSASGLSLTANFTAESNQTGAGFGQSVGTAGDVNGDGYSDVIVGASLFDNGQADEGRAYVFHGSAAGLSATANWTAESDQAVAQFGISVGTAGDVNGDGYADVIVGAYNFHGPESNEGRAYVFHGSSTGLSSAAVWTAEGDQVGAQFGSTVGTAGDVNDDGYADVVVGAVTYDGGETDEGRGYVYYGSPTGLPTAGPSWTAEGNQTSAVFAASIATAGDVNGDGYADVIVGAPNFDNDQVDEGAAFVYHGSVSGLPQLCRDVDLDGYVDCATACVVQPGQICGDCRDDAPSIHPGATEVCDGGNVDEDCDGLADDTDPEGAAGKTLLYLDTDGDGYGVGLHTPLCHGATVAGDCNNNDPTSHPGATEIVGDGIDENCDGHEFCYYDADDDGARSDGPLTSADTDCDDAFEARVSDPLDCNDVNAAIHPGASEACDGLDNDCNEAIDDVAFPVSPSVVGELRFQTDDDLTWSRSSEQRAFDVVRGNLATLRNSAGNFTSSLEACIEDGALENSSIDIGAPGSGVKWYYLVRAVGCAANGSYDENSPSQQGTRDPEIAASPATCP
jgi:hypothetical protein